MTTTHPHLVEESGVRFGIANAVLVGVFFAAAALRLEPDETAYLAVVVAGLVSCGLSLSLTVGIGALAWALFTGFVEHRYGDLSIAGPDLTRLATFALCTSLLAWLAHRLSVVVKENLHE